VIVAFLSQTYLQRSTEATPQIFQKGDQMPAVAGVDLRDANQTLFVVVRESCRFCTESMPLYKKLSELVQNPPYKNKLQIAILTPDPQPDARKYLLTHEVQVNKVASIGPDQLRALRITGTPTLILTRRTGFIEGVWRGKLSADGERSLLQALGIQS
jgi:hypothetical protein